MNEEDIADEESEDSRHVVKGRNQLCYQHLSTPAASFATVRLCQKTVYLVSHGSKCSVVMKLACCEQTKSAKFVVMDKSSGHETALLACEPVHSRIADGVSGGNLP